MQENNIMVFDGIPGCEEWRGCEKISKGWSSDQKYRVTGQNGEPLLLRISDASLWDEKKREYEMVVRMAQCGFAMSELRGFGKCNGDRNIYMLLTWVEGRDLEAVLPSLPENEQYRMGRRAGEILKMIHRIPVPEDMKPMQSKAMKKLNQLERYERSGVRISKDEPVIQFVRNNMDKIWREDPCILHGDFHPGNLIAMTNGDIGVIDFNRWEVGDPYEEFYKLESFGVEVSIPYCVGQIDAYFNDQVPDAFWETLAVYVAHASLFSIQWAEKFGQKDVDGMVKRCLAAMENYDSFTRLIPKWYEEYHQKV